MNVDEVYFEACSITKNVVGEECGEKTFYSVLYMVLREKYNVNMKQAMKLIIRESNEVDYRIAWKYKIRSKDNETSLKKVDGKLSNLLRIEALCRNPQSQNDYESILSKIRKEILSDNS